MRKIIFNKTNLFFTVMASMVLTSCLKDKGFDDGQYGAVNSNIEGKEWVSIPLGAKASNLLSLESKTGNQTIPLFQVSYDYTQPAAQDITVNIAVNNALVTAVDPTVVVLPAAVYTAPTSVTIKAGQRLSDVLALTLNTSTLNPNNRFGIGFTITGTSKTGVNIPANLKNVVFIFGVKNKYDGVYTMTGTLSDLVVTTIVAKSPQTVHLITTGANSVRVYNAGTAIASFKDLFPISNAGAESAYGAFAPEFIFDANNNVTAVVNWHGQPASNTRSASLDPSGVNKWDPVTKTLKVKWFMTQPSAAAGTRAFFDFTFTYVGPR